jgi:hypothetical protein
MVFASGILNAGWGQQSQKQLPVSTPLISFANKYSVATAAIVTTPAVLNTGLMLSGLSTIYYGQNFLHERKKLRKINAALTVSQNQMKESLDGFLLNAERAIVQHPNQSKFLVERAMLVNFLDGEKQIKDEKKAYDGQLLKYTSARNRLAGSILSSATLAGLWWWKNYYSK